MLRLFAGAFALTLVLSAGATALDPKPGAGLSGSWERDANGLGLVFDFAKDTLKITAAGGDNAITVTTTYTVEKGVVKAKVTKVEEKGRFPAKPPVGLEFSFKWSVKGDTATLDDLKGEGLEEAKNVLEGEYGRKKGK